MWKDGGKGKKCGKEAKRRLGYDQSDDLVAPGGRAGGATELGPGLSHRLSASKLRTIADGRALEQSLVHVGTGVNRFPASFNGGIELNISINICFNVQCPSPNPCRIAFAMSLCFEYHARCQYLPDDSQSRAIGAATPCPMCRVCKSLKVHATPAATFGLPPVPSPSQASTTTIMSCRTVELRQASRCEP